MSYDADDFHRSWSESVIRAAFDYANRGLRPAGKIDSGAAWDTFRKIVENKRAEPGGVISLTVDMAIEAGIRAGRDEAGWPINELGPDEAERSRRAFTTVVVSEVTDMAMINELLCTGPSLVARDRYQEPSATSTQQVD